MDWDTLQKQAAAAFDPIPKGEYAMTVVKSEAVTASTGKPMIKVNMRVDGGPNNGRLVFNNFVVSTDNPNAMGFFFRHMKAFGLDADFFGTSPSMPQVADALLGRSALVSLDIRQYQGQDQNDVKSMKPLTGIGVGMPGKSPGGISGLPAATAMPGTPAGLPAATEIPPGAATTAQETPEQPAPAKPAQEVPAGAPEEPF